MNNEDINDKLKDLLKKFKMYDMTIEIVTDKYSGDALVITSHNANHFACDMVQDYHIRHLVTFEDLLKMKDPHTMLYLIIEEQINSIVKSIEKDYKENEQ